MVDQHIAFYGEFRDLLLSYVHPELKKLARYFPNVMEYRPVEPKTDFVVLQKLPGYLGFVDPAFAKFSNSFLNIWSQLQWFQSYTEADLSKAFIDNYAYCEIVGNRGPLFSEKFAAGIFLIGPDQLYPSHSHEACEFYFPLIPQTQFAHLDHDAAEIDWQSVQPGEFFYNQSWQPHAIRTGMKPMMVLYLWFGGVLVQKSTIH